MRSDVPRGHGVSAERHLEWDGCFNVRDLGGLPTSDGWIIRRGAIVRADKLSGLTVGGWSALAARGIRTVIDLRDATECQPDIAPRPVDLTTRSHPLEDPADVATIFDAHVQLGGNGAILALPIEESLAIPSEEFFRLLKQAEADANMAGISGGGLTPYLLTRLAELSGVRTLIANEALIVANARMAARVATVLSREHHPPTGNRAL